MKIAAGTLAILAAGLFLAAYSSSDQGGARSSLPAMGTPGLRIEVPSLPAWHPPLEQREFQLPEGHPPIFANPPGLPEGHPPVSRDAPGCPGMGEGGPDQSFEWRQNGAEDLGGLIST